MQNIAVSSSNELKLRAVRTAMQTTRAQRWNIFSQTSKRLTVSSYSGIDETITHVAMCVSQLAETFNDSLCISISNGVHRACGKYFDFSAIAILTPDSPIIFAQSPWFEIPSDIIQEAISNNPHCYTWGEIAERFYGGDPNDPHKIVTRGKLSRLDTFVAGIRTAIMQIPWEKYPSSPPQAAAPAI